ncbi:MAG TPA: hypothetical protein VFR23_13815 [Jiangellaceae bacterium]|nr:hypothetical protein [Jiangellaceae bacterium]
MYSDRIWGLVTAAILVIMTVTALTDFQTSGWLLIPVVGAVIYWLVRQAVAHGVKQAR